MGCINSKTEGEGTSAKSKSNAPQNLAPAISLPTSKPDNDIAAPANSHLTGPHGSKVATSPERTGALYPDSGPIASPMAEPQEKVYITRYAYQARTTEDLSFEKGEKLLVVGLQESDWWTARSLKTQREGYIPKNYVAEAESYEAEE